MPHDAPTAKQLIESVREWLERDVLGETTGRINFHARVAINVLAMVERELELGPQQAIDHAARLQALGYADDAELAVAIRNGEIEETDELRAAIHASVRDKLIVAHPKYLAPDDARE
jgi:Domain of unknown function (DUF6285)